MLTCAVLVANNLRDIPTDTVAGKRTLAVVLGDTDTRRLYAALVTVPLLFSLLAGLRSWPTAARRCSPLPLAVLLARRVLGGAAGAGADPRAGPDRACCCSPGQSSPRSASGWALAAAGRSERRCRRELGPALTTQPAAQRGPLRRPPLRGSRTAPCPAGRAVRGTAPSTAAARRSDRPAPQSATAPRRARAARHDRDEQPSRASAYSPTVAASPAPPAAFGGWRGHIASVRPDDGASRCRFVSGSSLKSPLPP